LLPSAATPPTVCDSTKRKNIFGVKIISQREKERKNDRNVFHICIYELVQDLKPKILK
jgi:hypothetical protein